MTTLALETERSERTSSESRPTVDRPPGASEHTFASHDGVELFYRAWIPQRPTRKALLLLHRGHEHSGRLGETVERLKLADVAVFAWDQRGHGRSPGERGAAESVGAVVKDLDCFARHVCTAHGVRLEETLLMAHSVGGVIAAAWVHDYAPPLRGMVLLAPAFRVKLYVPLAIPALRLQQKFIGGGTVKSYVRSRVLTHDPEQQRAYDADELIFRQIPINILLDLHDTAQRVIDDAGAIVTPTLVLAAGRDWVVRLGEQRRFYERLSSPVKQMEVYPNLYHALLHESERQTVIDRARRFIDQCYADAAPDYARLTDADRGGYTRTEYDRLRGPESTVWKVVRAVMKTGGRLADGIRLGYSSGFDSGLTLDYVYANRPAGITPIGRLIDRAYLESIGWRGIRQRRVHLESLLSKAIRETHATGKPVHVLDIAAGAGRYVIDALAAAAKDGIDATALLRDYRQANLDAARQLAAERGLAERVQFELADAFDRALLAQVRPRPTIGIVSGLFELFPENDPLRRSLAGLADVIEPGGLLLYTCQPWHPQIEFIARALPNREGRPWIMRRRTQAEMDALVRAAGFEKIEQRIDRWGIFTVSLARREHE